MPQGFGVYVRSSAGLEISVMIVIRKGSASRAEEAVLGHHDGVPVIVSSKVSHPPRRRNKTSPKNQHNRVGVYRSISADTSKISVVVTPPKQSIYRQLRSLGTSWHYGNCNRVLLHLSWRHIILCLPLSSSPVSFNPLHSFLLRLAC